MYINFRQQEIHYIDKPIVQIHMNSVFLRLFLPYFFFQVETVAKVERKIGKPKTLIQLLKSKKKNYFRHNKKASVIISRCSDNSTIYHSIII